MDDADAMQYPIRGLDVVIMNPPYGSNQHRSRKYPQDVVKQMQKNEMAIRDELGRMDGKAGSVINSNTISTFFTPLADRLLDPKRGTLAKVLPVTALHEFVGTCGTKILGRPLLGGARHNDPRPQTHELLVRDGHTRVPDGVQAVRRRRQTADRVRILIQNAEGCQGGRGGGRCDIWRRPGRVGECGVVAV